MPRCAYLDFRSDMDRTGGRKLFAFVGTQRSLSVLRGRSVKAQRAPSRGNRR
jgi:hypothetical protein